MKDIAKDTGVSIITVSKVLRNHPHIRPRRESLLRLFAEARTIAVDIDDAKLADP